MTADAVRSAGKRRALVTGATGFLGGALCARLIAHGWAVRAPSRHPLSPALAARVETLPVTDLADWALRAADALHDVDAVFHLAARVHQSGLRGNDAAYRRDNVETTVSLARAAASADVPRFVFVSSVKAMAETSDTRPLTPQDPPRPEDAYGRSKLEAERGMIEALASGPTRWCIVRPPLVYGVGARANLDRLVRWIAAGRPLPLAAVRNRRSLIGRENLTDLLAGVAILPEAGHRILLPSDGDWSAAELVACLGEAVGRPVRAFWPVPPILLRTVAAALGQGSRIESLTASLQIDDPWLRDAVGWRPEIPAREGLTMMARAAVAGAA